MPKSSQPQHQHYRNPLKGGWYYVGIGDEPLTGLMTKRCARRHIKAQQRANAGMYGYGILVLRHSDAPRGRIAKIFTRPKISG